MGDWCVGDDVNTTIKVNEKKGVSNHINREEIEDFNEFIQSMKLMDFPWLGNKFTLFNLEENV